jgi:hypothetical protein
VDEWDDGGLATATRGSNLLHTLHPALAAGATILFRTYAFAADPINRQRAATGWAEVVLPHEGLVDRRAARAGAIEMEPFKDTEREKGELARNGTHATEIRGSNLFLPGLFVLCLTRIAPAFTGRPTLVPASMFARLGGDRKSCISCGHLL